MSEHAAQPGVGTGTLAGVARRGAIVLWAMRREYESRLWRDEARAQLTRLATGTRAGTVAGRDHDGVPPRSYRPRQGGPELWLRPGTGDGAVWGEVNARSAYVSPWPIPPASRVLDLGGHAGYFARWALAHWPVRTLVSVEPDAANIELLERNARAVGDARWSIVAAAASTAVGTASFAGGRGCGSGLRDGGEDTVPTVDGLELLAESDVAKVDIEGAEWAILDDPRFAAAGPPIVVLEYHPAAGIADPSAEARRRLTSHGYEVLDGHADDLPGIGVVWARRPAAARPS